MTFVAISLALLGAYIFVAGLLCIQLNNGAHRWCPLCQCLRACVHVLRRIP